MLHSSKNLLLSLLCAILLAACSSSSSSNSPEANNDGDITRVFSLTIGDDIPTNTDIPTIEHLTYNSFDEASAAAKQTGEKTLVLDAVAVQLHGNKTYTRSEPRELWDESHVAKDANIISKITAPRLSLTFGADGNIHSTSLYVADQKYTATYNDENIFLSQDETSDALEFIGKIDNSDIGLNLISAGRKSRSYFDDAFDFTANYMIAGAWTIITKTLADDTTTKTDTHNYYTGFFFAGMETSGTNIGDMTDTVTFKGTGNGYYTNQALVSPAAFDLTANVDFSAHTIGLETVNTIACFDNVETYPCVNDVDLSFLDFTATLTYDSATNNINGTVSAGAMEGFAEARFYGTGDNAANELGGTFAMIDNATEQSYHGIFGGKKLPPVVYIFDATTESDYADYKLNRSGVSTKTYNAIGVSNAGDFTSQTAEIQQTNNKLSYSVTLKSKAVDGTDTEIGEFASNGTLSSRFHIGGDDDDGAANLRVHHLSEGSDYWLALHDDNVAGDGGSVITPTDWQYQTLGIWKKDGDFGVFSTGLTTNDIPTSGNTTFNGISYGFYTSGGTTMLTRGTTTVTADFENASATLAVTGTRTTSLPSISSTQFIAHGFTGNSSSAAADLNFTADLAYDFQHKWFRGDANNATLTDGTAVMKLYGADAQEAGGTFKLTGTNKTYIGAFGF